MFRFVKKSLLTSPPAFSTSAPLSSAAVSGTADQPRRLSVQNLRDHLSTGNTKRIIETFNRLSRSSETMKEMNSRDFYGLYNTVRKIPRSYDRQDLTAMLRSIDVQFKECGIKESAQIFLEKALILKRLGYSDALENLFLDMENNGLVRPINSNCMLCESHANAGRVDQAVKYFEDMLPERMDSGLVNQLSSAYHAILDAYISRNDFKVAFEWWKRADEIGIAKTEMLYDTFMTCLSKQGLLIDARELLEEREAAGFKAGTRTYNILLRTAISAKKYDEALNVFKEMTAKNIPSSALTYNLLMGGYSAMNDPVSVLRIYFSMISSKSASDVNTSRRIGETFSRDNHAKNIKSLIKEAGGVISIRILRTILQGMMDHSAELIKLRNKFQTATPFVESEYEKSAKAVEQVVKAAKDVFETYRLECGLNERFNHNLDIYQTYINVLTQSLVEKEEIKRVMKAVDSLALDVGNAFYNRVLYFCSRSGDSTFAHQVYTSMVDRKIPRNLKTYDAYIYGMISSNMPEGELFSQDCVDVLTLLANDPTVSLSSVQSTNYPKLNWILYRVADINAYANYKEFLKAAFEIIKNSSDLKIVNRKSASLQN